VRPSVGSRWPLEAWGHRRLTRTEVERTNRVLICYEIGTDSDKVIQHSFRIDCRAFERVYVPANALGIIALYLVVDFSALVRLETRSSDLDDLALAGDRSSAG